MSISQYALRADVSRQAIIYRIKYSMELPGVEDFEMIGGRYILYVDTKNLNNRFKNKFRRNVCQLTK